MEGQTFRGGYRQGIRFSILRGRPAKGRARMAYMNNSGLKTRPPVMEGKTYNVEIKDIGAEGDGLAKIDNFPIFVPGTKVGDKVDVKIEKVFRSNAFGLVVKGEDTKRR